MPRQILRLSPREVAMAKLVPSSLIAGSRECSQARAVIGPRHAPVDWRHSWLTSQLPVDHHRLHIAVGQEGCVPPKTRVASDQGLLRRQHVHSCR